MGAVCVDHPDRAAARACPRCGGFLCEECGFGGQRCRACTERAPAPVAAPGIGGWLVLPMLALFAIPLRFVATLIQVMVTLSKLEVPVAEAFGYDPGWFVITGVSLAAEGGLGIFAIANMFPFFGRRKTAIVRMQLLFGAVLLMNVVNTIVSAVDGTLAELKGNPAAMWWPMVLPIIWVQYFRKSERVKATFVRD